MKRDVTDWPLAMLIAGIMFCVLVTAYQIAINLDGCG